MCHAALVDKKVVHPAVQMGCTACHAEAEFKMRAGATEMQMVDIIAGKLCGKCHNGNIAWAVDRCDLCHSGRPGLATGVIGGNKTGGPDVFDGYCTSVVAIDSLIKGVF